MAHHPNWIQPTLGETFQNYVDGAWQSSEHKETFLTYNPADRDEVLGFFQQSSAEDVQHAVESAHHAFQSWSKRPGPERAQILMRVADRLEESKAELASILSTEQGKILAESQGEVERAVNEIRFAAGEAYRFGGDTVPSERFQGLNLTTYEPLGVIAAITPWNFPLVAPVRKIAPALAYGCTVVLKPASYTPWTAATLIKYMEEAGVPDGVVNLTTGRGSRVGNALIEHPLVSGISFTGSTRIGKSIQHVAARRLVPTQLELGGKNPALVMDDHDLDHASAQIIGAAFTCSGQRCTAISRVIVQESVAERLVEMLIKKMKEIKVGAAWEEGAQMGPMVSPDQLESVQQHIHIGQEEGATLRYGGQPLVEGRYTKGSYMTPTLFDHATPQMRIAQEEIFGPVLSVIRVKGIEEAIEAANNVQYGLAASVFTQDLAQAKIIAQRLECGMVHFNLGTASEAHMPFGGVKDSGYGAYSIGRTNKDFYTRMKVIYV